MPDRDIVVIGASAGGVEAISQLVAGLPPDFPAALFVVVHFPPQSESVLPAILTRRGPLQAIHPRDGDPIRHGRIYVAPNDRHLLVQRGRVRVVRGPVENGHRPAVDVMFRSAALAYGPRVVAVVLTGFLDDGTSGLVAVKHKGGTSIVQDPNDALAASMPASAIEHVSVDHIVPLSEIPALLDRLVREPVDDVLEARPAPADAASLGVGPQVNVPAAAGNGASPDSRLEFEVAASEMDHEAMHALDDSSLPSTNLSCPACGGTLWEMPGEGQMRYRCRVGHGYSADTLLASKTSGVEDALWAALRTLEESVSLSRRMADRAKQRGHRQSAARLERHIHSADERARLLRRVLLGGDVEKTAADAIDEDLAPR